MATGAYDAQGVWQYGEDDPASPFSDLLNLGQESVSDGFATDRARLGALEDQGNASVWVPSWINVTVGNGVETCRYARIGDLVFWSLLLEFGSTTAISGTANHSLPVPALHDNAAAGSGFAHDLSTVANRTTLAVRTIGSGVNLFFDGGSVNGTAPFTWAAGDRISVGGVYFAAG